MSDPELIEAVASYYDGKLAEHGPTPAGVDWNGGDGQQLRFDQLLAVIRPGDVPFTLIDYGCGYGALLDRLVERWPDVRYVGLDVAPGMLREARRRHANRPRASFAPIDAAIAPVDFTVASGVFNVRLDHDVDRWRAHVLATLDRMVALSRKGIAFNALTAHADGHLVRPDLFYADPGWLLDHCLRRYGRDAALRHDYPLYEFTVLLRLDGRPPVEAPS
jgi:SAM-dependent methyltransferase